MVLGLRKAKRPREFRESREIRMVADKSANSRELQRPKPQLIPDLVMVLKVLMVLFFRTVRTNKTIKTAADKGDWGNWGCWGYWGCWGVYG